MPVTIGQTASKGETRIEDDLESTSILDERPQLKPPRTLESTLFDRLERLYGSGIKRVLQVQYRSALFLPKFPFGPDNARMNERIACFPSETLYDNRLISSQTVAKRTLLTLRPVPDEVRDDAKETLEPTVVFFDTAGCEFFERSEAGANDDIKLVKGALGEGSKSNENEAVVVVKWAKKLVGFLWLCESLFFVKISLGIPAAEVAVVTPYQAQVSLISSMLLEEFPEMTIGSVDGLQGQEREVKSVTPIECPSFPDSISDSGDHTQSCAIESHW